MKRRQFVGTSLAGVAVLAGSLGAAGKGAQVVSGLPLANNAGVQVINAGIGGNNTVDLLARIEQDCLLHKPGLVIFMAGTNDMNSKKFIALPEYKKNMQQMIAQIKKTGAELILMNLLPVYEPYLFTRHERSFYEPEGHAGRLREMNMVIKQLADRNKSGYLDLHLIFERVGNIGTDASSLIKNEANSKRTDGVHPTPDGYRMTAVSVYGEMACRQWVNNGKIVCFGDSITRGDGVEGGENYPSWLQKLLN